MLLWAAVRVRPAGSKDNPCVLSRNRLSRCQPLHQAMKPQWIVCGFRADSAAITRATISAMPTIEARKIEMRFEWREPGGIYLSRSASYQRPQHDQESKRKRTNAAINT